MKQGGGGARGGDRRGALLVVLGGSAFIAVGASMLGIGSGVALFVHAVAAGTPFVLLWPWIEAVEERDDPIDTLVMIVVSTVLGGLATLLVSVFLL